MKNIFLKWNVETINVEATDESLIEQSLEDTV